MFLYIIKLFVKTYIMKKLFVAFAFVLGFAGIASAQTKTAPAPVKAAKEVAAKPAATTKTTPAAASTTKTPAAAKPVTTAPAATTGGVKLKADGTPDKRYKATATNIPLKKDGTPDKRFKGNK
jgi:hypothetical protein